MNPPGYRESNHFVVPLDPNSNARASGVPSEFHMSSLGGTDRKDVETALENTPGGTVHRTKKSIIRELARSTNREKEQKEKLRFWLLRVAILVVLLLLSNFGLTVFVFELKKETAVDNGLLTDNTEGAAVLATLDAQAHLGLRYASVIDFRHLETVDEITYTFAQSGRAVIEKVSKADRQDSVTTFTTVEGNRLMIQPDGVLFLPADRQQAAVLEASYFGAKNLADIAAGFDLEPTEVQTLIDSTRICSEEGDGNTLRCSRFAVEDPGLDLDALNDEMDGLRDLARADGLARRLGENEDEAACEDYYYSSDEDEDEDDTADEDNGRALKRSRRSRGHQRARRRKGRRRRKNDDDDSDDPFRCKKCAGEADRWIASCHDGVWNGNEDGVDCGGICHEECPQGVNGGWSYWTPCFETINDDSGMPYWGHQPLVCESGGFGGWRGRTCTNPAPAHGGLLCPANGCNEQVPPTGGVRLGNYGCKEPCPVCPTHGEWSDWGHCDEDCGGGHQWRTCTNPAPADGGNACEHPAGYYDGSQEADCPAGTTDSHGNPVTQCRIKACNTDPCCDPETDCPVDLPYCVDTLCTDRCGAPPLPANGGYDAGGNNPAGWTFTGTQLKGVQRYDTCVCAGVECPNTPGGSPNIIDVLNGFTFYAEAGNVGEMKAILVGSGKATVTYGECWDQAPSRSALLHNDVEIDYVECCDAERPSLDPIKTVSFDFEDGDSISFKDEGQDPVVLVISITYECGVTCTADSQCPGGSLSKCVEGRCGCGDDHHCDGASGGVGGDTAYCGLGSEASGIVGGGGGNRGRKGECRCSGPGDCFAARPYCNGGSCDDEPTDNSCPLSRNQFCNTAENRWARMEIADYLVPPVICEVGTDCQDCGTCPSMACTEDEDCEHLSGWETGLIQGCNGGVCGPSCTDGVHNGDESQTDCGGSCTPCCESSNECPAVAKLEGGREGRDYPICDKPPAGLPRKCCDGIDERCRCVTNEDCGSPSSPNSLAGPICAANSCGCESNDDCVAGGKNGECNGGVCSYSCAANLDCPAGAARPIFCSEGTCGPEDDSCTKSRDGACDTKDRPWGMRAVCAVGTDCTDCGLCDGTGDLPTDLYDYYEVGDTGCEGYQPDGDLQEFDEGNHQTSTLEGCAKACYDWVNIWGDTCTAFAFGKDGWNRAADCILRGYTFCNRSQKWGYYRLIRTSGALCNGAYEAEEAHLSGPKKKTYNLHFSGSAYVDYVNDDYDGYIEWTLEGCAPGAAVVNWRYANGDSNGDNRPLDLVVNGGSAQIVDFPDTDGWWWWGMTAETTVTLQEGTNKIRLVAKGGTGPNVDLMSVSPAH